ncbi:Ig-like domain repeat protein [Aquirufa sp. ROCK2-A2]
MKRVKTNFFKAFMMISLSAMTFVACQKEEEIFPIPTVSASSTIAGTIGTTVSVKATINAPAGIKSVIVLKNGVSYDSKTYSGEKTAEYAKDYVVENLAAGSVVNFTLQVVDSKNQVSTLTPIAVTVAAIPPKSVVEVKGIIEGNVTWSADKIYKLVGFVRVGEETVFGNVTKTGVLTIQPGTTIIGDKVSKGTLIVQRGSKLIAEGTAEKPIVFTSERNVGEREAGDWGGLVICGKAPNNLPDDAKNRELEGAYGAFHGGSDAKDNSGSLKYVRLEFAGIPINPNQEVNSLTMASVGSGTTIDFVQASFGLDDSFEWFGGTVNAKHLIAYKGLDDDFDTDNGFSGYVQFGLGIRGTTQADQSGSNGFECDNDANGSSREPFTSAVFANMSIIGSKGAASIAISPLFQHGAQLRRNNKQKIYNTLITGYPFGVYIDSQKGGAKANAANGDIDLQNIVLAGVEGWGSNGWGTGFSANPKGVAVPAFENMSSGVNGTSILIGDKTPEEWFKSLTGNKIVANTTNLGISNTIWASGRPTLALTSGTSESLIGPKLNTNLPSFFEATDYVGAFKTTDWTLGWAEFSPQSVIYIK